MTFPAGTSGDPANTSGERRFPLRLDTRPVYSGSVVDLSLDTVRFPDGSTGELEMIRHSGASAVVAIAGEENAADPQLLLVRQFRYAAGGFIYEIPAGRPSRTGEPWAECAKRELEEETGWAAASVRELTCIFTTPGFTDEKIHIFLATGLHEGTLRRDPDEFLEVQAFPLSECVAMIGDGRIVDAKTICGVLFYANRRLRS